MPEKNNSSGINDWLLDEFYEQYRHDRRTVDKEWKALFESETRPAPAAAPAAAPPPPPVAPGDRVLPLRGAPARIAENMTASLAIPVATSQRVIPVKVIDENRQTLNHHRTVVGGSRISYTHLVGWAIVRALESSPTLNHAYTETPEGPARLVHGAVNLGIAVDVAGKDGARALLVPNIKNAQALDFYEYMAAFDDIVGRARTNRLTPADFQGTTISLTNPGTVGTVQSVPRLMPGQGAIIATGAIDYPAGYQGSSAETRAALGISKVMTMTCTYDHRVIQGAESGLFLGKIQTLLEGEDGFYDRIFADLKVPYHPVRWEPDRRSVIGPAGRRDEIAKQAAVLQMINAYRVRGHLIADLDPLGREPAYHPELDPATYGLTIWDLDREFLTGTLAETTATEGPEYRVATLRVILETLRHTYCGKIGCEYMNIQHPEQKLWLQQQMEPRANNWPLERAERLRILDRLLEAEEFEHFLGARFIGHKRFSLEGAEAAIPILDGLLNRAAARGVREVVIGMAHRGRINVLANITRKPLTQVFSEFEGNLDPQSVQGSGDVKYHLGATGVHHSPEGAGIAVSVAPNPSHLEAVDPVVEGVVRPKQDRLGDEKRELVIPVLIHGDAAFAGQGVVAETLNLSQLEGYHTGGTVHLVINNQIGFTTGPDEARSTPYSTDVARMVQAPIFHVNGDDPEACLRVTELAFEYRQRFKKDVVIDMFCYRRHGHNETDDPSYTQPLLYHKIRGHIPVAELYSERLRREGIVSEDETTAIRKGYAARFSAAYDEAQRHAETYELQEIGSAPPAEVAAPRPHTAIDGATIDLVLRGLTTFPEDFHLHPKLRGFIDRRRKALDGAPVDWALGEALAFGSLVLEGTPVRLSGQDSGRGTFSQRHLEYFDSESGKQWVPLKHLASGQARFDVVDSALSEYAVMGFEFGYSVGDPLTLVLWEAQFGDFANGAQIMIDQFLSAAESKWGQPSGLVLLLPHGYEGQGPEHSSARIERFLQLCAEDNMQVVNATTPAQYFHLLRRQMYGGRDRRGLRKPLIVFTPKSLLRHHAAVSPRDAFTSGAFQELIPDSAVQPAKAARLLLCSGKIYYDLAAARQERDIGNVAIARLEQLYPFPAVAMGELIEAHANARDVFWVQEEPLNMGAWRFVREQMESLLEPGQRKLSYAGRPESASTAAGTLRRHQQEQAAILAAAFDALP